MTLYETLEIDKSASQNDIKKAYHILARKYHPDKNKDDDASVKFKEIKSAYEVLSDPERRNLYDLTGGENTNQFFQNIFQNFQGENEFEVFGFDILDDIDVDKMFENINTILKNLGGGNPYQNNIFNTKDINFNTHYQTNTSLIKEKSPPTYININAKLEDIFMCLTKEISIENNQKYSVPLYLTEIEYPNKGDRELGKEPGDVIINVNSKPHIKFKRIKQYDLLLIESILLSQIYKTYYYNFTHLDGKKYKVKIDANILASYPIIKINSKGLPKNHKTNKGDLYIYFQIDLPKTLEDVMSLNTLSESNSESDSESDSVLEPNVDFNKNGDIILLDKLDYQNILFEELFE
jgi:DnaJ-class molecular chaperone